MNNEYVIINKTKWLEVMENNKKPVAHWDGIYVSDAQNERVELIEEILSQSTPLIPDIKDIQIWLSKQSYQKEYGEQEYMMYYDVDVPKIIQDYISNLKLDI